MMTEEKINDYYTRLKELEEAGVKIKFNTVRYATFLNKNAVAGIGTNEAPKLPEKIELNIWDNEEVWEEKITNAEDAVEEYIEYTNSAFYRLREMFKS